MPFYRFFFGLMATLWVSARLSAQSGLPEWEAALIPWSNRLVDSLSADRQTASDSLFHGLRQALALPGAFEYPFDSLQSISRITAPDGALRLVTWQLRLNDSTWQYKGFLLVRAPVEALFVLTDQSSELPASPRHEQLDPDRWYGALYYNIFRFEAPEGTRYLLFGYKGYSLTERQKLIDVLWFDPVTRQPRLGDAVFEGVPGEDGEARLRFMLEYYAEAKVRLNWDEQYQRILFDHLIPMTNPYDGTPTRVPDGSYQGFELKDGRWHFIDNVFNDSQEEVPRPFPVLDDDKNRDILGREKKKKKN
ncbi:MAG: hypothetical protein SFV52_15665 [Saprospiraceae bacterium]|nr:hypothetical protein [Saprospiraceae bacterium]